jgi:exosortase A
MNTSVGSSWLRSRFPVRNPAVQTLVMACALLLSSVVLFFDTWVSMIVGWNSSETYTHCYLVIPVALFLIWHSRTESLPVVSPSVWLSLLLIPAGLLWLTGKASGVLLIEQIALISLIVCSLVALTGLSLAKGLWFPLCFMFLAVPFGEELVPVMMEFTADFTVAGLQMMGFPVFRQGNNFTLPSGNWSVVEACSGVRYLIASFTIGALYAYITYNSLYKRSIFLIVSIIVPVIGNGLRAIMIVLIGHYSSMTLATGVDHLIYGWLFFGLLMFLLFWFGGYFADARATTDTSLPTSTEASQPAESLRKHGLIASVAVAGWLILWPLWAISLQSDGNINQNPGQHMNFHPDYTACDECTVLIKPEYAATTYAFEKPVLDKNQQPYQINILSYDSRAQEGELINSQNRIIDRQDSQIIVQSTMDVFEGRPLQKTTVNGVASIRVWHFNTLDTEIINSRIRFKLKEAMFRITGRDYIASAVIISSPMPDNAEEADRRIARFLSENKSAINGYLEQLAK